MMGVGLVAGALGVVPATGQPAPQQVTSDTAEYCLHLQNRVSALIRLAAVPPPHEVSFLSREGQRMCGQGQTRGGILRLRRALMLMEHTNRAQASEGD